MARRTDVRNLRERAKLGIGKLSQCALKVGIHREIAVIGIVLVLWLGSDVVTTSAFNGKRIWNIVSAVGDSREWCRGGRLDRAVRRK